MQCQKDAHFELERYSLILYLGVKSRLLG